MTVAVQLLSKIILSLSPVYGVFVVVHFFSDKFNYARRALCLSPFSLDFFEHNGAMTIFNLFSGDDRVVIIIQRTSSNQFNIAEIKFLKYYYFIIFDILNIEFKINSKYRI